MEKNNYRQNTQTQSYVGAPYNFVPLNKHVKERYTNTQELPKHNIVENALLSGEIHYQIKALTDISIGSGNDSFYLDGNGKYAIPGSSMRGLVRSNMQILGQSSIADDVEDYRLMYRSVGKAKSDIKDYYDEVLGVKSESVKDGGKSHTISVTKNVKAGYLKNENGKFIIYKPEPVKMDDIYGELNYYPLRETTIFKAVREANKTHSENPYAFLKKNDKDTILQNVGNKFEREEKGKRARIFADPNVNYKPYQLPITYEVTGKKDVTAVGAAGDYRHNGYVVSTGFMRDKKTIYIIPECTEEVDMEISKEDVLSYRRDYEGKKNQLGNNKEALLLPKEGEMKVIFYIWHNSRLFFGFTPYLRLFYNNSIKQGIPKEHWNDGNIKRKLDYVSAMLGYSDAGSGSIDNKGNQGNNSYKSRIYFEDAQVVKKTGEGQRKEVLASPKLSSYHDYLMKSSESKNFEAYNGDFAFRGIKQYWLRDDVIRNQGNGNEKTAATVYYLGKGSQFEGVIRFKNLAEDELGLLLWSIFLDKGTQQNIGMAKPLGYGRIDMQITDLRLLDYERMYKKMTLDFSPYDEWKGEEAVDKMWKYIQKYQDQNEGIADTIEVKTLMAMKNPECKPEPNRIRYMDLDKKEYKNRDTFLPMPGELIQNQSLMDMEKKVLQAYENKQAKVRRNVAVRGNVVTNGNRSNGNGSSNGRDNEQQKTEAVIIGKRSKDNCYVGTVTGQKGRLVFLNINKSANAKGVIHISKLEGTGYKLEDFKVGQKYYVVIVEDKGNKPNYQCALSL